MRPLPPPAVTQSSFPLITHSHNHACYVYLLGSLIASRDHCVLTPPPGISRQRRWTRDSKPPCPVLEPGLQLDRLYKAVWGEGEKKRLRLWSWPSAVFPPKLPVWISLSSFSTTCRRVHIAAISLPPNPAFFTAVRNRNRKWNLRAWKVPACPNYQLS